MKTTIFVSMLTIGLALGAPAQAQPPRPLRPGPDEGSDRGPAALSGTGSLLRHFGMNAAMRLTRSSDADDRLRGIERAVAMHTPEALSLLERAARPTGTGGVDPRLPDEGFARRDPRALLTVVHGLADWLDNEGARASLTEIVRAASDGLAPHAGTTPNHDGAVDDAESAGRVKRARQEAAIALAASGNTVALEALVAAARSGGPEQEAALIGLTVHPPSEPVVLGGVALTTPATIAMAAKVGDLRTLDAILGVMRASDPALRAAALSALAAAGDTRAADLATDALHDEDARVRVAAAEVFARLGMTTAGPAVEALIADDATALEGLRLARSVQSEGVVKAAAARAAASADPTLRGEAIAVLGRQAAPSAVQALSALAATPPLESDAAGALARSPSRAAVGALQEMAGMAEPGGRAGAPAAPPATPASRRLAARAYFVRRYERDERSEPLDKLLESLAVSSDPRDRAVGMQALVALGERRVDAALSDPDAHVRRAGAMGALGHWDATKAEKLVARGALEPDEATRRVLALGWTDAGSSDAVPTSLLADRAVSGGPDAPAAAFALARRFDETLATEVDTLLHARDAALRTATARGLGLSGSAEAAGRLSLAYEWEADPSVRRAIVSMLTIRAAEGAPGAAAGQVVLDLAARLDPDPVVRWTAAWRSNRANPTGVRQVAWIRLVAAEGATPSLDRTALLSDRDGRALPIAFDAEGYALIPGISPGEARLRLAPDSPSYTAPGTMSQRIPPPSESVVAAETPSFEVAIKRLTEIVQVLERGELPLEESLRLFEEGVNLSRVSQQKLDTAEKRVEQLLAVDEHGRPRTTPFATDSADEDDGDP